MIRRHGMDRNSAVVTSVPLRAEVGPRDLEGRFAALFERDNLKRTSVLSTILTHG